MPVSNLDHINLRASRELLDQLRDFYCHVVGLSVGSRPAFSDHGYWLYAGEQAVVHLSVADAGDVYPADVRSTFAHVAFACSDRASHEHRLEESGVKYDVAVVPTLGLTQLFFQDPAGNGVELTFDSEES